jgi:hypothetical protein
MLVLVSSLRRRRSVVNNVPLRRSYLNGRFCVRIFDGVYHSIEMMGLNDNLARSNFGHRIFRRVFAFKLLPFRFLWFCPISFENAIT